MRLKLRHLRQLHDNRTFCFGAALLRYSMGTLVGVALAECGSSTAPRSDLAGRWTGSAASYAFTVVLVDDRFKTATGTATVGPWAYLQLVAIETDPNRITLDLEAAQSPSLFLTGTVSGNAMRVSVDGGPFHGDSLTLTRQ